MRTIIVGAGIGGLSLAMALEKLGLPYMLLSKTPQADPGPGATIIWPNALTVLDHFGIADELRQAGRSIHLCRISTASANMLSAKTWPNGESPLIVAKTALRSVLWKFLQANSSHLGHSCVGFSERADGQVLVQTDDARTLEAELVIGADGAHSIIRRQLWGEIPVRHRVNVWQGLSEFAPDEPHALQEVIGDRGDRIRFCAVTNSQFYWQAETLNRSPNQQVNFQTELRNHFGRWGGLASGLIQATPGASLSYRVVPHISDRRYWGTGRCTLLGNAAEPCDSNLLLGDSIAIEEAGLLARLLAGAKKPTQALRTFEALRSCRSKWIRSPFQKRSAAQSLQAQYRWKAKRAANPSTMQVWTRLSSYDFDAHVHQGLSLLPRFGT